MRINYEPARLQKEDSESVHFFYLNAVMPLMPLLFFQNYNESFEGKIYTLYA